MSQKNHEVGKLPWASVNSFLKFRGLEYKNSKMASLCMYLPYYDGDDDDDDILG